MYDHGTFLGNRLFYATPRMSSTLAAMIVLQTQAITNSDYN